MEQLVSKRGFFRRPGKNIYHTVYIRPFGILRKKAGTFENVVCVCVCVCVCVERGECVFNLLAPELFFFNFSTPCIYNVNNTGTKQVRIMKHIAF